MVIIKSLKVISPQSSIKLNRLQVVTGPLDDMELAVNDNQKYLILRLQTLLLQKSLRGNSADGNQNKQQTGSSNPGPSGTNIAPPPVLPRLEPVDMN